MNKLFDLKPLVIAALHLPVYPRGNMPSMSQIEDYALSNMATFAVGGMPAVILQDETPSPERARPETLTMMAALARLLKKEYPAIELGIIIEAHDPLAALAVAFASGASFVRIKVFVGSMLKSSGIQMGCGIEASEYRHLLNSEDLQILADVHDRTGTPMGNVSIEKASRWAANTGANGLVLTGSSFNDSLQIIQSVRNNGVNKPLILGGSATVDNVSEALKVADGVIVSSALKRKNIQPGEILQWDQEKIIRFMEAARQAV